VAVPTPILGLPIGLAIGIVVGCIGGGGSVLAVPALVIFTGTIASSPIPSRPLLTCLGVLLLVVAATVYRRATVPEARPAPGPPRSRPPGVALTGAGVGFLNGFFGVGGGFLIVPTLIMVLGLPTRIAIGTSLVIVAATSAVGFGVHMLAGQATNITDAAVVTAGCAVGAIGGASVASRLPARALQLAFAGIVVAVGGYVLAATTFGGVL
jgi:uncharacterized membrane protein YfcA